MSLSPRQAGRLGTLKAGLKQQPGEKLGAAWGTAQEKRGSPGEPPAQRAPSLAQGRAQYRAFVYRDILSTTSPQARLHRCCFPDRRVSCHRTVTKRRDAQRAIGPLAQEKTDAQKKVRHREERASKETGMCQPQARGPGGGILGEVCDNVPAFNCTVSRA